GVPLVLTGDGMNEFMVDYKPVEYRGVQYYALPRLDPARLRKHLVAGLDAGDREIGVFRRYGIDAIQPYALCAAEYTSLPSAFLELTEAKQLLVREVMGDRVPAYVYERPKTRAQCGDAETVGGTLAVLANEGIDSRALQQRCCERLGIDPSFVPELIYGGLY